MGPDERYYCPWMGHSTIYTATETTPTTNRGSVGAATQKVVDALKNLEDIDQKRVLKAAAILLGLQ